MELSDFATPSFYANPYPLYEKLRASGPLVPIGTGSLITGRHDVVEKLLQDRRMVHNNEAAQRFRYGDDAMEQPVLKGLGRWLLLMNAPVHTRLRGLMTKAFSARKIEAMRDDIHIIVHRLLDQIADRRSADLMSAFAMPLPVEIICRLLGVPLEDAPRLVAANEHLARMLDTAPADEKQLALSNDAYQMLEHYFGEIVEARRREPHDDLVSMLLAVEEDGDTLTHDEIVANVIMLFIGGHETTASMICNTLVALQRHPDQLELLKRDPAKLQNALLECLRYEGASHLTYRFASEDIEISGMLVPRNTFVYVSLGAANRDPAKYRNPDKLDIGRDLSRIVSFGGGIHHCLGIRLALLELEVAISALLTRLPQLSIVDIDGLSWHPRSTLRSLESLHARW